MKYKQSVLPDYQGGGYFRISKCRPYTAHIIARVMNCAILGHGKNFFERQVQIHCTILVRSWTLLNSGPYSTVNEFTRMDFLCQE